MKRTYEPVAFEIVPIDADVIMTSASFEGQQSFGSDNVVSWWETEGPENGN